MYVWTCVRVRFGVGVYVLSFCATLVINKHSLIDIPGIRNWNLSLEQLETLNSNFELEYWTLNLKRATLSSES